jgi:hypothetical protein
VKRLREQDECDHPDRNVDQEDQPPGRETEQAAEDRPGRGRNGTAHGPHADGPGPPWRFWVGVVDQRHRRRHHHHRACALRESGGDKHAEAGR